MYIYIYTCIDLHILYVILYVDQKTVGLRLQTWVFEGAWFARAGARLPQNHCFSGEHDGKPQDITLKGDPILGLIINPYVGWLGVQWGCVDEWFQELRSVGVFP